jgi:hypothetical protein
MEWVNDLKQRLKTFIHENAVDLGVPHLARNSALFSMFQQVQSSVDSASNERVYQMQQ